MVPPATRRHRRAGEAVRQGHVDAGAHHGRSQEWRAAWCLRSLRSDGCNVLLELRDSENAGCAVGAALASHATAHADEVEYLTFVRGAHARPGETPHLRAERRDLVARCRSRTAWFRCALSLSRGAASTGDVSVRLFDAPAAAARDESRVRPNLHRRGSRPGEEARDRLQRRREHISEWTDPLPRTERAEFS